MSIVKGKCSGPFVTVLNVTAQDTRLSNQARGLLFYLLSLPEDWTVNRKHLSNTFGINCKTVQKQINELKEYGYCIYHKETESGRFTGGSYHIYPVPFDRLADFGYHLTGEQLEVLPESLQTTESATFTVDPQNGLVKMLPGSKSGQHTKETNIQNKKNITTTTEKPDFYDFAVCLLGIIKSMISEGGWIPDGQPAPKSTWLKAKAKSLFDKFTDPRPEDCAVLILKDWTKLINTSGELR